MNTKLGSTQMHWNAPLLPLPDDARIEVVVASSISCYFNRNHALDLLAYAWSPLGLWKQMCLPCAQDCQANSAQPMRWYEPCEEHRTSRINCRWQHA